MTLLNSEECALSEKKKKKTIKWLMINYMTTHKSRLKYGIKYDLYKIAQE